MHPFARAHWHSHGGSNEALPSSSEQNRWSVGAGEGQIYKCLIEGGKEKYLKLVYAPAALRGRDAIMHPLRCFLIPSRRACAILMLRGKKTYSFRL